MVQGQETRRLQGVVPMGVNRIAKYVLCPFYHKEDNTKICCEGTDNDNVIHLTFVSWKKRMDYETKNCCKDYKSCKIAQMLYKKYEENKI